MSFKLAEAYVSLTAQTQAHDAAVDKATAKVKTYGIESEKMKTIGSKAFLMLGLGVGAMEAALMKGAQAFRLLISSINDSLKAGTGFGHGVARWIEQLTGLETAIAKSHTMLEKDVKLSKVFEGTDVLAGRVPKPAIEGLPPERAAAFQAQRAALMGKSLENADELAKLREGQPLGARVMGALGAGGAAEEMGITNTAEITAAEQRKQAIDLQFKQLDDVIAAEIKQRKDALAEQEKIAAREKAVADFSKEGLLKLGKLLGEGSGALAGLDAGAGEVGGLLRRDAKRRQGMDHNELPEDMVDIAGFAATDGGGRKGGASIRSQMMGAQEFARAMMTGTAGQSELEKTAKEQLKALEKIDKSIQETAKAPTTATFASGGEAIA